MAFYHHRTLFRVHHLGNACGKGREFRSHFSLSRVEQQKVTNPDKDVIPQLADADEVLVNLGRERGANSVKLGAACDKGRDRTCPFSAMRCSVGWSV